MCGQVRFVMANQAVFRLRPLVTVACRNVPSNSNSMRMAAFREGALRLLHFHSQRRNPHLSKA